MAEMVSTLHTPAYVARGSVHTPLHAVRTKELLRRAMENLFPVARGGVVQGQIDPLPFVARAFENVALARVSTSAREAVQMGLLAPGDRAVMNRDHLVHEAKQSCLALAREGFRSPRPATVRVMGAAGRAALDYAVGVRLEAGSISEHDALVAGHLARVLTGGDAPADARLEEAHLLDLEREAFLSLCGHPKTQARMAHLLKTGRPLRN